MRILPILAALLLAGCNTFDFLSPHVVEGVLVGVELSDGDSSLGDGPVFGAVFLAEATSIRDVSSNLVTDPDSLTLATQGSEAPLESVGDGLFFTGEDAITGLTWTSGEAVELEMVTGEDVNVGSVVAPAGPSVSGVPQAVHLDAIPEDWAELSEQELLQLLEEQAAAAEFHPTGQPLSVDLSAEDYEYWIVVVADQFGNVTYDNIPRESQALIDWVVESEPIDAIEIPGTAFPEPEALYAVGVAGVVFADTQDYTGFNWLISNVGAGTLTVTALVTE
jgi:hypothetical protein